MGHTIVLVESDGPAGALTRQAFDVAGVPWGECQHEEQRGGRRVLVLVPSCHTLTRLPAALARVAHTAPNRLRVVVFSQPGGFLVPSTIRATYRLLADPRLRDLVVGPAAVGIVAEDGVLAGMPAGTTVHALDDGVRLYLLPQPTAVVASVSTTFRLAPFPDTPAPLPDGGPSTLLRAADRVVPFFGREAELARLASWRDAPGALAVLLVHGPGGQGKTRLATEFAERSTPAGWLTLQALHEPAPPADAGTDPGGVDVLVVVDYAERWPRPHLTGLVEHLLARGPGRVRVLLVARQAGLWWKGLTNPLRKIGARGPEELRLGALADTVAQRRVAFDTARDRFADLLGVVGVARLRPVGSLDHDDYRLALTLHMAALVVVDAHARGATPPEDPGSLSGYLTRREYDHWLTLAETDRIGTPPDTMARLVTIATLTQSLPQPDAETLLTEVGLAGDAAAARSMIDDHSWCYPPHGSRVLTPLLPDRLGEDFVAEALPDDGSGTGDPWSGRLPALLVTGTAGHESAVLSVLIETAARWEHVRCGYLVPLLAHRPELVLRAEGAALVTLAGYADPDLLEAVTAVLPERHTDLDTGIAALVGKLTEYALARTDDPAERARLYQRQAARLSNAGLHEDAVVVGWEAVAIRRELAEHEPDRHEPALADTLSSLGIDLWRADLLAESVTAMHSAVEIYRRHAAAEPDAYAEDLAAGLTNLTGALIGAGSYADALGPAEEAKDAFLRLGADRPGLRLEIAAAQRNLAIVLGHLDRRTESLVAIGSAVALFRQLAAEHPQVHDPDLADSLHTLGNQLAALDRNDEALAVVEEGVTILRRLVVANAPAHEYALSLALTSLGGRRWQLGDHDSAIAAYEEAVQLARRRQVPGPALPFALGNLARRLARLGDHDSAIAAIEEAIDCWRTLAATSPSAFDDRLARALATRAEILDAVRTSAPRPEPA